MKKYLIAALAIIAIAFSQKDSFGQSNGEFAPDHAEWWHYNNFWMGNGNEGYGLIYSFVNGDTIIQNQACKIIKQKQSNLTKDYFYPWLDTISTYSAGSLYIYDAGDTVLIFNENFNRFTPLFVFNVNEGDTVCLPIPPGVQADLRPNPIANGDTCFCFQIDSIRMVLYDTIYLETYFQHALYDSLNYFTFPVYNWQFPYMGDMVTGVYSRKTGGQVGGFLPIKMDFSVMKPTLDTIIHSGWLSLKCYQEDSFAIHLPDQFGSGCFFDPTTSIRSVDDHMGSIQIYPNPNNGILTLEASSPFEQKTIISIADLSGRVLKSWKAPVGRSKIELNVKDLNPGMYLLRFEAGGGMLFRKVVVQ